MKDIGVKMSKKKSTNFVLSFDDDWLAEENGESNEIGDNLAELCGEEEETDCIGSEECLEESEEPADNANR